MCTVYIPTGSTERTKRPCSFVTVPRAPWADGPLALTRACPTGAPLASRTRPTMSPVVCCAPAGMKPTARNKTVAKFAERNREGMETSHTAWRPPDRQEERRDAGAWSDVVLERAIGGRGHA